MVAVVNGEGDVIREVIGKELQVSNALEKWATRLNKWEYSKQIKRSKGKRLKQFFPNVTSLEILKLKGEMISGKITPDEAMAILSNPTVRAELNICVEAGF